MAKTSPRSASWAYWLWVERDFIDHGKEVSTHIDDLIEDKAL
jgi:hypothetical protein